ncbi:MAG: AtpZ/AtpI family protein [FCB group bacterium]
MEPDKNKNRKFFFNKKDADSLRDISPFITMGWQMVLTILLCLAIGWWLDKQFNTHPWLIIGFSVFGIVAAMVNFIKTALNAGKNEEKKDIDKQNRQL